MTREQTSARVTILKTIHEEGSLGRSAIARKAGLSVSTVSVASKALVTQGLLVERGVKQQRLGRPAILLSINPSFRYVLGAKVNAGDVMAVLTDLNGKVLAQDIRPLRPTPSEVVAALVDLRDTLTASRGIDAGKIAGAGLALSGLVNGETGICIQSTVLGWRDVPIAAMLREALHMSVAIENDANALAVGEHLFGQAQHADDFAVVSIGHGIGTGLFVHGELLRGELGAAGELGHCTIEPEGPPCACGKRGCLEALASVPALLEQARASGLAAETLDELEALVRAGDASARALLHRTGRAIGLALSHLVNLFNPQLVILTGSEVTVGAAMREAIEESLKAHTIPMLPRAPRLLLRHEGADVWARAAASLSTQAFFSRGGDIRPVNCPRLSARRR